MMEYYITNDYLYYTFTLYFIIVLLYFYFSQYYIFNIIYAESLFFIYILLWLLTPYQNTEVNNAQL